MAKHVVVINDKWGHQENSDCPCHPDCIIGKDGDLIYVHEDFSKQNAKRTHVDSETASVKPSKTEEMVPYMIEMNKLVDMHDRIINKAIEEPKAYEAQVIQHLNNGILSRMEYLAKKIAIIEHGLY